MSCPQRFPTFVPGFETAEMDHKIPYDYTVEVRYSFKALDRIDGVPDELWTEVRHIVEETGVKTIPMKRKHKKAKQLSEEAKEKRKDISI